MKSLLRINSMVKKKYPNLHIFYSRLSVYKFAFRLYYWRVNLKSIRFYKDKTKPILNHLFDDDSKLTYKTVIKNRSSFFKRKWPVSIHNQYFMLDQLGFILGDTSSLTFIDAGAYDGNTIKEFITYVDGVYSSIYSFEPDPVNFINVKKLIDQSKFKGVTMENKGLYEYMDALNFNANSSPGSSISELGNEMIDVVSLDDYLAHKNIANLFIKMDIEGAELPALRGSMKIIKKYSPALAICIYHSSEDLFEIPLFFISNFPYYKLFVRHHSINESETVLYAIPQD